MYLHLYITLHVLKRMLIIVNCCVIQIFSKYGNILRIVTFVKNCKLIDSDALFLMQYYSVCDSYVQYAVSSVLVMENH